MKTAHQNAPTPQTGPEVANKDYVDTHGGGIPGINVEYKPATPTAPPVSTALSKVVFTPSGTKGFLTNYNNDGRPIYAFRPSDNKLTATVSGVGNGPLFAAMLPSGSKLYVVDYYASTVDVVDAVTNAIITTISGFTQPTEAVALPNGTEVYVADFGANQILRIDTTTDTIVGSPIPVGTLPWHMAVTPDSSKVYVTDFSGIQVISTSSHTVIATITGSGGANGLAVTPDGSTVYFNASVGFAPFWGVQRINTTTDTVIGSLIATGNGGQDVAITPSGAYVYALNAYDASCSVIRTSDNTVVATITGLIGSPQYITINPAGTFAYVTNQGSTVIDVISTATNTVVSNSSFPFATPSEVVVGNFQTMDFTGAAVVDLGAGAVSVGMAAIFDNATLGVFTNIRGARDSFSPVDNSKNGVTNFGTADGNWNPTATGATGNFSTISGGDDNQAGPVGYEAVGGGAGNVANGDSATIGGGFSNKAIADYATVGGGQSNQATSINSVIGGGQGNQVIAANAGTISGGSGNLVKADYAYAEGFQTSSQGQASHAEGRQTQANQSYSHAEGYGTTASGIASHSEGQGGQASGSFSHNEGIITVASGNAAHAEGNDTQAIGSTAHSEGEGVTAQGDWSHAQGYLAQATFAGQHAHGSGPGTTSGISFERGAIQHSVLTMAGKTPGSSPGETVELDFGLFGDTIRMDYLPGSEWAMTIVVTGVARSNIGPYMQSFRRMYGIRIEANVPVLVATGALEQIGDASASSWTLTGSIGTVPDRFKLEFSTGATTVAARVVAKVELVEVNFNAV